MTCNPADNRWAAPYYATFSCPCLNGYVDVGTKKCKKCSELMPGCTACNIYNLCLTCQPDLQPSIDKTKCQCIDSSKFLTRTAECIDIDGCLNSLNGTAGTKLCIECDLSKNLYLTTFKCECLPGYVPDLSQSYLTCIEQCGNKIITVSEQCDDGNAVPGDGCSSICQIEQNYDCFSNYTDASFCILNFTVMRHYETLKILDEENTAEVYFTFQPYFQKYFDHMNIFKSLFNSSSLYFDEEGKFMNITYEFVNHEDKEIRFKIRFKYNEKVNQSETHYVRFFISDMNRTHYLTETVHFTLKSKNYPLYMNHETQDMHETLSYVLLSGIIVGYLLFFISLLSESWIGIELMNTLQWFFMYFFIFDNVEGCLSPYINILKLSLGYNKITNDVSPYVHYTYHDQLWRFGYVKQFFFNFNFSALLFCIPILMVLLKLFAQWRRRSQSLSKKAFTRIKKKEEQKNKKQKPSLCDWFKNKNFLSFDFIVGRLLLSFVMFNLLQSIFSFFIQLSPWFELDDRQNNVLYTLYMYGIILLQLGVCAWVYIEIWERLTFDSQSVDPTHRRVFKFDGFKFTYPLIFIFIQVIKIVYFVLSFEENICLFVMMGCDGVMLMFYIFYRPYTKSDQEQQTKGYFIHNMHNIWNCLGLSGFLVLVYFVNKRKEEEVQSFSSIIIYCVIGVCYGSLLFTLIRLLQIAGVFDKCLNKIQKKMNSQSDKTQNPLTQIKLQKTKIQKETTKKKFNKPSNNYLTTISTNSNQLTEMPDRTQIIEKIKGRYKESFFSSFKQEQLIALQKSRSSRTTYKKK